MAVNLVSHKDALLGAWKDVVDDKTSTNWALFGYDKQSYDLCVVSTGDGGLEELVEELNCGKIMYAFCKVEDPNTSLSKFILINWQGEGAPLVKKGCCANHFMDIDRFFKGSHITITARTEDDVEPALILDKVSKCTASTFNFKQRSDPTESTKPIGSVYKRIQPAREISSTEREKFWMKEQEEEKRRVEEEKVKAEAARNRLAEEVKERELKDARAREEWFKERSLSIDKMREAEKNAQNSTHNKVNKKLWEQQLQEDMQDEEDRKRRSQHLRTQRNEEAQALIAQRTFNAKAMFEPSTYTGTYASQAVALLRASFPSIVSVSKQMMTRNSGQLLPSISDGSNQTTGLPVVWLPSSLIDGATFPAFPLWLADLRPAITSFPPYSGDTLNDVIGVTQQMVVGKHHYNFQCCPEPACTFYVPNKADKNAKYKGTAIKAMTKQRFQHPSKSAKLKYVGSPFKNNVDPETHTEEVVSTKFHLASKGETAIKRYNPINCPAKKKKKNFCQSELMVHLQQPPEQHPERQPQLEMAVASPARAAADGIQNNHGPSTALPPTELTYTRNLLRDALPPSQQPPQDHEDQSWEEEPAAARAAVSAPACMSDRAPEAASENGMQATHTDPADTGAAEAAGPGLRARALYDYQAADDTEISFDPDDVITHIEQIDEGWWQGLGPNGTYGLFPANYVELID
ncbi:unnamed protein product [Ixodes pacificus]